MDFTLSLKYRLISMSWTGPNDSLFLAFTGRFGFYLGTRSSSPVIGKSYNPKLLWRHVLRRPAGWEGSPNGPREYVEYLDFAYAHESDGQSIDTPAQLRVAEQASGPPQFANEYISRGWDYLELVWKKAYGENMIWSSYVDLRYFLADGLLQGRAEEYHSWEDDPQGKPRRAVDGLTGIVEYHDHWASSPSSVPSLSHRFFALKYQTGYQSPFRYSTVRAEAGAEVYGLPLVLWAQTGYMSDLANYFRKVNSFGVELRITQF